MTRILTLVIVTNPPALAGGCLVKENSVFTPHIKTYQRLYFDQRYFLQQSPKRTLSNK